MKRIKKEYRIFTFHTTTAAMSMEKRCMEEKIPGRLIPVPREISAGCGLAYRIPAEEYPQFEEQIRGLDIPFENIYLIERVGK